MKLGHKLALQTTALFLLATVPLLTFLHVQSRAYALQEAERVAKIILAGKQATINYVVNDLRPPLFELLKQAEVPASYFEPSWMSAGYINRTITTYFRKDYSAFYYKNATLDARSPANEANAYEAEYLEKAKSDPGLAPWRGVIEEQGKPFFIYMQPNRSTFGTNCMRCHSTPDKAPADLVTLYGPERSFNKKVGEVSSVLSLRIPLAEAYAHVNALTLNLSMFILCFLGIIFVIQWLVISHTLVAPIRRIKDKALAIANGVEKPGEQIVVEGKGELSEMAQAFSTMSIALGSQQEELEALVEIRTRELQQEKEACAESEKRFRLMMHQSPSVIELYDTDGLQVDVNQAYEKLWGFPAHHTVGKFNVLKSREVAETGLLDYVKRAYAGESVMVPVYKFDVTGPTEGQGLGRVRWLSTRIYPLKGSKGLIKHIVVTHEDMSEVKLAEQEKARLETQLIQAHKMQAIGTLAGGIAHEFNNLLGIILGSIEMATDDLTADGFAGQQLNRALKAGNRAKELVQQILTFSRKKLDRKRQPMNLASSVLETMDLLSPSLPSSVEVKKEIGCGECHILADATEVGQILMNLCANAVWAMKEKGLLIVSVRQVEVSSLDAGITEGLAPGIYFTLSVSDTGAGMDRQTVDRVFEPFYTTKEVGQGTGMGLATVHGIVKSYGGAIVVDSEPGQGTTFHLYFPALDDETSEKESVGHSEVWEPEGIPTGTDRVLLVDDEEVYAETLTSMLEHLGYSVSAQTRSPKALEVFRAAPDSFDLVITDQVMPDLSGDELSRELLAIRPDLPIILATGYSSQVDEEKAKQLGIKAYILKPIVLKEIGKLIRQVLDE